MIENLWQLFAHFMNGDVIYIDQVLQRLCGQTTTISHILCTSRDSQDDKFNESWNLWIITSSYNTKQEVR